MDARKRGQARTIEEVHYDLAGVYSLDEHSRTYRRLLEVLAILPQKVYEKMLYKTFFAGGDSGAVPVSQLRKLGREYLVILDYSAGKPTIAHELAHVHLGHGKKEKCFCPPPDEYKRQEKDAWKLAKQWLGATDEDLRESKG
jgi:hypothetical protein